MTQQPEQEPVDQGRIAADSAADFGADSATGIEPDKGCGHQDDATRVLRIAQRLGLPLPDAHTDPHALCLMAALLRRESRADLAFLPFCCTVEAEALGAHINLGNDQIGPRPSGYAYDSLAAFMDDNRLMDFSIGRIHAILEACQMLKNQDEMVAVEISGPVSILSALVDFAALFKCWRKDAALTTQAFLHICGQLERYARELRAAGVDLISFADPAAAPHIIGPRFSSMLATTFLAPFLENMVASLPGTALHLCPHSASGLVKAQLAEWKDAPASGQASYQQACLSLAKAGRIFGKRCIKRTSPLPPQGMLPYLQLHKSQEA